MKTLLLISILALSAFPLFAQTNTAAYDQLMSQAGSQIAQKSLVHNTDPAPHVTAILFDQLGAVAGKQYSGEGLAVTAIQDGARLRCAFQRLDGHVTTDGLWLVSTKDGSKGVPFRVAASAIGRARTEALPDSGSVQVCGQTVRFIRSDVTEEYSVSIDGLRQDFVIEHRPLGHGPLRLELEVDGAKAEAMAGGARLVLAAGGRNMVYNRLLARDAMGRQLTARLGAEAPNRLVVMLDDTEAQYPIRIDPTISDANWTGLSAGVSGAVYALAVSGANLYAGGSFTTATGISAANIAEWNGNSWSAMGSGINGTVYALAVSGTNLYAGGTFTVAGGVSANNIGVWNGSSWSAVGTGVLYKGSATGASVNSLALSSNNLFVGGTFTTAGGTTAYNIAEWNGSTWSPLGSGLYESTYTVTGGHTTTNVEGQVDALAILGNNLYAAGSFSPNGGSIFSSDGCAEWNGTSWTYLGTGGSGSALAVSGNNLYVGGNFTIDTVSATNIAEWNGSAWSALGEGVSGAVTALAVSQSNLYVGGGFTNAGGISANNIAVWNRTSWSAMGSGMNSNVLALTLSGQDLFAGGHFTTAGVTASLYIAKAVGVADTLQFTATPTSGTVPLNVQFSSPSVDSGGNTILSWNWNFGDGSTSTLQNPSHTYTGVGTFSSQINVISSNGIVFPVQGAGPSITVSNQQPIWKGLGGGNSWVFALAMYNNYLYAGGSFTEINGVPADSLAVWNGNSWSPEGSGMNGTVYALAVSPDNLYLYAGGDFTTAYGIAANHIANLGPGSTSLGSGINGSVRALAVSDTTVYAGGIFTSAGGVSAEYVAQWNGSSWSPLGSGLFGQVNALVVSGTTLYAGGLFTTAGGVSANYIAQWNGSSWSPLGSGMNGIVTALAVSGTNLYAGGNFTTAGGVSANYIAQWNGSSWSPLGSGMNGEVTSLAASGTNLYAGGYFYTAGGVSAAGVARWNGSSWSTLDGGISDCDTVAFSGYNLYVGGDGVEELSPSLQFVVAPTNGTVPLAAQFYSPNADNSGVGITQWNWNFGDGSTSTLQNPSHTYTNVGTFTPSLVAVNTNGVAIDAPAGPGIKVVLPTIQFEFSPTNGIGQLMVQFTCPSNDSSGAAITQWHWNFGDGSTSTLQNPSHTYTNAGTFIPTLIMTNSNGVVFTAGPSASINVVLPTVQFAASPTQGIVPVAVQFSCPSVDNSGSAITQWNWNFGNGSTSTAQNPSHIYADIGNFSPSLIATNGKGQEIVGVGPTISAWAFQGSVQTLHNFSRFGDPFYSLTNSDGAHPETALVLSGNRLFGMAYIGGTNGNGTVFAVDIDGTGFTNLFNFPYQMEPIDGFVIQGNTLYGVGDRGGAYGDGMIFKIDTDGSNYTVLYNFNGAQPTGGLVLSGGTLYGVYGVDSGGVGGTVFSIGTDGSDFTILHTFNSTPSRAFGRLLLSGGMLYGAAPSGGSYGNGAIFEVSTNGDNFQILHNFSALTTGNTPQNSDGASPNGGLILSGNTIYGTAQSGGQNAVGTVFALNTNGSGFTSLHSFLAPSVEDYSGTMPTAGLTLSGRTLYGIASGVIFAVNTDGTGFTNLYQFSTTVGYVDPFGYGWGTNTDGSSPQCQLISERDTLYGTAAEGGNGVGTVFSLTLVPDSVLTNYPNIISQTPTNSDIFTVRGATETMSVTATGPSLQYQWFNDLGPIKNATNSSLVLSDIDSTMDGNNYWVVVSNWVGSVSSTEMTLHVVLAARQLPTGDWPGVGYWPNVPMTYTIEVGPPSGTFVYAVQEQLTNYPSNNQTNGLTEPMIMGPISDGGTFDSNNYIIKWGPFFDASPRTFTYVLTPPPGTTNWAIFSGIISIDGTNYPVEGDNAINLLPLHPADNGGDNSSQAIDGFISFDEMIKYASSWRSGNLWPVEPNPIPINYMTSAGFIWSQGGYYIYEPSAGGPPNCWVNTKSPLGSAQSLPAANPTNSASTVVSSMPVVYTNDVPFTVTLTVTPTNSVMAYAVEDQVPAGWMVTNISSSGVYSTFDSYNNEVKWGPIFSATPTSLTYQIIPPTNATGTPVFAGVASFDGANIPITGVRQTISSSTPPVFQRSFVSTAGLVLTWSAVPTLNYQLQYSTNLALGIWVKVGGVRSGTNSTMTVTNAIGSNSQGFYRVQLVQ